MLILGLPDWGCARSPACGAIILSHQRDVTQHNALLSRTSPICARDWQDVGFVDVDGLLADMQAHGSFYGLTIVKMGYQKNAIGRTVRHRRRYNWTIAPPAICSRWPALSGRGQPHPANFVQAKTYGCRWPDNAQTANESIALLTTMLTTRRRIVQPHLRRRGE